MIIARRIIHSPVGAIFMAIRDNPIRARAVGHAVERYKLLAFTIAAAYAGFAGGLLGVMQGYMPPDAFTFDTSGELIMQTMIGGPGFLFGPLAGAAVWLYLRDFLQSGLGLGAAWKLVLGIIFVLLVCFLRRGVIGGVIDLIGLVRPRGSSAPAVADPLPPDAPAKSRPAPPPGPVLEVRGLTRRFGGLLANDDIDFTVETGELRGIIGPNGAGKSTFFKMLTVRDGADRRPHPLPGPRHHRLGRHRGVPDRPDQELSGQPAVLEADGARESCDLGAGGRRGRFRLDLLRAPASPRRDGTIADTLALVGLTDRADVAVADLAVWGETPPRDRPRTGHRADRAAARRTAGRHEPAGTRRHRATAENIRVGRTLVLVEHDMDAIFDLAERITVLYEGRVLAEGTPAEIQASQAVQDAYLGGEVAA